MVVVVLGEGGGRWAKSGWDCRKVEVDCGDFQRSVGDRSVGKVWQLIRWVIVWSEERQCRGRGGFNFVEVGL